jgi:hypothetical protein
MQSADPVRMEQIATACTMMELQMDLDDLSVHAEQ